MKPIQINSGREYIHFRPLQCSDKNIMEIHMMDLEGEIILTREQMNKMLYAIKDTMDYDTNNPEGY
jgi:hypothetical protein